MITVEAWTTIRFLHAQGKSVRAIAREPSYRMQGKLAQSLDQTAELKHDISQALPSGVGQISDGKPGQV